jgi:hypothetical protein
VIAAPSTKKLVLAFLNSQKGAKWSKISSANNSSATRCSRQFKAENALPCAASNCAFYLPWCSTAALSYARAASSSLTKKPRWMLFHFLGPVDFLIWAFHRCSFSSQLTPRNFELPPNPPKDSTPWAFTWLGKHKAFSVSKTKCHTHQKLVLWVKD